MRTQPHQWAPLFSDATHRLESCIHCGLFRLRTLNSEFYLVRWSEPYSQCKTFPYEK